MGGASCLVVSHKTRHAQKEEEEERGKKKKEGKHQSPGI